MYETFEAGAILKLLQQSTPIGAHLLHRPASENSAPNEGEITLRVAWPENYLLSGLLEPTYDAEVAAWIEDEIERWVKKEKLDYGNADLVKMIREIDLGILSTSMFPRGVAPRLLWAAKCNTLLAMADDLFAEQSIESLRRLSNDPGIDRWEVMRTWANMFLSKAQKGATSLSDLPRSLRELPILRAWSGVCEEAQREATPLWLKTVHWGLDLYVKACFAEYCLSVGRLDANFEDYCIVRIHNAASIPSITLCDFVQGYDAHYPGSPILNPQLGEDLPYHPTLHYYLDCATLGAADLLNDCLSASKESVVAGAVNAVKVLMQERPDASVHTIALCIERTIQELLDDGEARLTAAVASGELALFGHPAAGRFLADARIAIKGLADWQVNAKRYQRYQSTSATIPPFRIESRRRS